MKRHSKRLRAFFIGLIILSFVIVPTTAGSFTAPNKFVRVANYYLVSNIPKKDYEALSKFDLLILPMEAQYYDRELFKYLRTYNSDIIILPYVPAQSINTEYLDDPAHIRKDLYQGIDSSWWLYDSSGKQLSTWPGTLTTNVATDWSNYLANFVKDRILSTGLWDGVFYDFVGEGISWFNDADIDLDRDGIKDESRIMDETWRRGMTNLFRITREFLGPNKMILTNGSSVNDYQPYVNGRMYESFPTPWLEEGRWENTVVDYKALSKKTVQPSVLVINTNTGDTGNKNDFQKVRFGLASTLLGDGYYSFDHGITSHAQLWWYDEYDVVLGLPKTEAKNVLKDSLVIEPSLWRRDFQNGLILVNSTAEPQTLKLGGEYEKLHGSQDPDYNNGAIVQKITLASRDGIILLRPIEEIRGSTYTNGSFVRIFNNVGQVERTGFFAYNGLHRGNTNIVTRDLNNNGELETLVADVNHVDIFDSKNKKIASFYPYGESYDKGINITVADLDNNGTLEIITGTARGGGPHIRIFNYQGRLIHPGFFAYGKGYRGGVNVTVADLNGDGWKEIIAGAGVGGGPHIRIFNSNGKLINPGFFAFDPGFRGGVNVAAGDLDGDGKAEIIAGAGAGGGPQVRIFNKDGKVINPGFFAFDKKSRKGVKVVANDLDGDGKVEILATTIDVFTIAMFKKGWQSILESILKE